MKRLIKKFVSSLLVCATCSVSAFASFDSKIYKSMPEDKNYLISPTSIKFALTMLANGANGETKKEILDLLETKDIEEYNKLMTSMIKRYSENKNIKLNISNSFWINKDRLKNNSTKVLDSFKDIISKSFNGTFGKVNDKNAIETINKWAYNKTNGQISNLIDNPLFAACLINAIYFKGDWASQFKNYSTTVDVFTDAFGRKCLVDFMHKLDDVLYYEDKDVTAINLPYKDKDIGMYIAIPTSKSFDINKFNNIIPKMEYRRTDIAIPKFHSEFELELLELLKKIGIDKAFSENSEFSNIFNNNEEIKVDKAIQKTSIDVTELGTEASAVTAIALDNCCLEQPPEVDFSANRPFYYFIRDNKSGEILFMGRYAFAEKNNKK